MTMITDLLNINVAMNCYERDTDLLNINVAMNCYERAQALHAI